MDFGFLPACIHTNMDTHIPSFTAQHTQTEVEKEVEKGAWKSTFLPFMLGPD